MQLHTLFVVGLVLGLCAELHVDLGVNPRGVLWIELAEVHD